MVSADDKENRKNPKPGARAGKATAKPAVTPPTIDASDRNEVMAVIRELFSKAGARDREQAIRDVAHALGHSRVGPHIREVVNNPIQTAVRRKIIVNQDAELSLFHRNIGLYPRDHLIDVLLAAMGTGWWERKDALVAAARHLGYRRTAKNIRAAFKSAIKAAIRRGRLETSGPNRIRRL